MNDLIKLALDQRRIKSILNLIFVASIASKIFELAFFEYTLLDITNIKSIYFFFIDGHFIIPFILFYLVWTVTIGLRMLLFQVPNFLITNKIGNSLTSAIVAYYKGETILNNPQVKTPTSKSLQQMMKSFEIDEIAEKNLIRKRIQSQERLESSFTLIFRALIAITMYFIDLSYFTWLLYVICVTAILLMWIVQIVNYQLAEVAPDVIKRSALEPAETE